MKTTRTQRATRLCIALGWKHPHHTVVAAVRDTLKLEGKIVKLRYRSVEEDRNRLYKMHDAAFRKAEDLGYQHKAVVENVAKLEQELAKERAAVEALKAAASTSSEKYDSAIAALDAMHNDRNYYRDIALSRFDEIVRLNALVREQKKEPPQQTTTVLPSTLKKGQRIEWWNQDNTKRHIGLVREALEYSAIADSPTVYAALLCNEDAGRLDVRVLDDVFDAMFRDGPHTKCAESLQQCLREGAKSSTKLIRQVDELTRERDLLRGQNESALAAQNSVNRERDAALADVARLAAERDGLVADRKILRDKIAALECESQRSSQSSIMPNGNVRVPFEWRVWHQRQSGEHRHSTECCKRTNYLQDSDSYYSGCIPSCPMAVAYLAETKQKRVAPVLPSSLRPNQRVECTGFDGKRHVGVIDEASSESAHVVFDAGQSDIDAAYLHDCDAKWRAITILDHAPVDHSECKLKLAETRESLRSTTEATHMLATKWHTAETERDAALRDLGKARSELAKANADAEAIRNVRASWPGFAQRFEELRAGVDATRGVELVQVPAGFMSNMPHDGECSNITGPCCIRKCPRRLAWEAAGCPKS